MLFVKCITVGDLCSNCYILYSDTDAVVIDPGADGKLILNKLNAFNVTVRHIILTHGHFDHIGAVQYLKDRFDCDVYINANDAPLLSDPNLNLSSRFGDPFLYSDKYIAVNDETVNLIDFDFTFISTPGHTPGSMCIKVLNYLFTGDTLFHLSIGNAFSPYGDMVLEVSSIKSKLFTIDDDLKCFPGHNEPTTLLFEKQFNPHLI